MPMHTIELGTRELIVLMELTSNVIEGDRFRYPDESAAKRIHQKAEAALGFERATRLAEDVVTSDDESADNERESEASEEQPRGSPASAEIVYRGPSLDELLGEGLSTDNFR
jgi:hypothetical protein